MEKIHFFEFGKNHPYGVLLETHLHWRPLSLEIPFIGDPFHWKPLSLETPFIGNPFHWKPISLETPFIGDPFHWRPKALHRRFAHIHISISIHISRRLSWGSSMKIWGLRMYINIYIL